MKININICGCTIANIESDDKKVLSSCICAAVSAPDDGMAALMLDKLFEVGSGAVWIDDYLVSVVAV